MKRDEIQAYGKAHKAAYSAIRKDILAYDKIVVYRHIKPDFDALGCQMGLVHFLKDNFPNKEIHYVGDDHVSFTPRIFPEMERLPESFHQGKGFLAIVCDVGDAKRVADPRFQSAGKVVKFDHHPCREDIAEDYVLDVNAASASEIVADFCLNWKGKTLTKAAAENFYIGIVGDSGRFLFSSTSSHTFDVASSLIKTGINMSLIYQKMYEKPISALTRQAYVLNHYKVTEHGFAYYLIPIEVENELGIVCEQGKENVNMLSNIEGIEVWASITQDVDPKDPCWRISLRSKSKDISALAAKWGGGGHAQASGCQFKDLSQLDAFVKDVDGLLAQGK